MKKKCTMCGKEKDEKKEYYLSNSLLYKENDKRLPICKDCVAEIYESLLKEYESETIALNKICNMLDTYYSERAYNIAKQHLKKSGSSLVKIYFQKINSLAQFKGYTSKDSETFELTREISKQDNIKVEDIDTNELLGEIILTKDVIKRWGIGLDKNDYIALEIIYQELTESYENKTPAQDYLYRDIAKTRLEQEKCRRRNDIKGYADLSKVLSTQMGDGNIKPAQKNAISDENADCWGVWTQMIEENEPVGEASNEYKDVDGIYKYILKWFIKPFGRVLGLTDLEDSFDNKTNKILLNNKSEGDL